jgi:hypothetical protein
MSTPTAIPEIAELEARYHEAGTEYDRLFDAEGTTGADMRLAGEKLGRAWETYAEACRDAGICVRPGCSESVVTTLQRLCPTHRSER